MNDEIRRQLEAAGRRPVPDPRPEFRAALEARLLAVARTPSPETPAPPARRRPGLGLAFGFGAVAIVLGFVTVLGGEIGRAHV